MGSDGLFDMMMLDNEKDVYNLQTKPCKEIKDWCISRWLQDWEGILADGEVTKFKYSRTDCDDVSVAVIDITPL
jgi:hypothetical protein